MRQADPVRDETRTTHNYFAHGGNELVIGGKLTFLPTATVWRCGHYARRQSSRQRRHYDCGVER